MLQLAVRFFSQVIKTRMLRATSGTHWHQKQNIKLVQNSLETHNQMKKILWFGHVFGSQTTYQFKNYY